MAGDGPLQSVGAFFFPAPVVLRPQLILFSNLHWVGFVQLLLKERVRLGAGGIQPVSGHCCGAGFPLQRGVKVVRKRSTALYVYNKRRPAGDPIKGQEASILCTGTRE